MNQDAWWRWNRQDWQLFIKYVLLGVPVALVLAFLFADGQMLIQQVRLPPSVIHVTDPPVTVIGTPPVSPRDAAVFPAVRAQKMTGGQQPARPVLPPAPQVTTITTTVTPSTAVNGQGSTPMTHARPDPADLPPNALPLPPARVVPTPLPIPQPSVSEPPTTPIPTTAPTSAPASSAPPSLPPVVPSSVTVNLQEVWVFAETPIFDELYAAMMDRLRGP